MATKPQTTRTTDLVDKLDNLISDINWMSDDVTDDDFPDPEAMWDLLERARDLAAACSVFFEETPCPRCQSQAEDAAAA